MFKIKIFLLLFFIIPFSLFSQEIDYSLKPNNDKFKSGEKLILTSENKEDTYLISITDKSGNNTKLIPIKHIFTEPFEIQLDKTIYIKGEEYIIKYSIPNSTEYSGSSLYFKIKPKFINRKNFFWKIPAMAGALWGLSKILLNGKKSNPTLPEPPLPGGN